MKLFCTAGPLSFGLLFLANTQAQTFTGSVVGRVSDPQHHVIANARVNLMSADRGFERHTGTNAEGEYLFPLVAPGRFTVRAEAHGFAPSSVEVEVAVATPVRADLNLSVQELRQQIQVFGESGVAVQTENADLGRLINPHEMSELPSLTRSPYDFMALIPGAVPSNDLLGVGYAVNGARTQSANYLLDGSENNDAFMSAPGQNVPLDSVQEFNIQTNHYSAEYGRNSGLVANVVTKTGTNQWHGSIYDYMRNSALAANTYDNNANGFPRPVFNRHQFGGTVGGPIRKQDLFFFAAVEPIRVRSSTTNGFFVPTAQLLTISAPGTQAIFQRFPLPTNLSSTNVQTRQLCPFGLSCDPQTGAGFVQVPAFAFTSRVGPQDVGAGPPQNTLLATGRLDWVMSSKLQAFVRYAFEQKDVFGTALQPYSTDLDIPISARNQNFAVNVTRTWSSSLGTESRVVYNRVVGDPERFGGDNPIIPKPPFPCFGIESEPAVLPCGSEQASGPMNFYQLSQTAIWSRAHHTLTFGGQFVHIRQNITYGVGELGDATFSDAQGFVDGVLQVYEIALNPKGHFPGQFVGPPFGAPNFRRHFHYNEPALFISDTWKVTPRLTLTPGLRWEYFGVLHSPPGERDLDSNFYLGQGSDDLERIANGRFLRTVDAPGKLRGHFYEPDYKDFAPRLGIAYDLTGDAKTVVRAGIGVFYDRRVGWELFRAFLNPPNYSLANLNDVNVTSELLTNPYAAFPQAALPLTQSDAKPIASNLRSSYTTSWNLTIEREVRGSFVLGASYLAASGSRLYSVNDRSRRGSGGLLDPTCVKTRFASDGTPLGPDYTGCSGLNSSVSALVFRENSGHSSFEALQMKLDSRRLARWGAEFGVNYTWGHSIDNGSISGVSGFPGDRGSSGFLDAFNPSLDRGPSDFDVRHRIAAHWIWEVPIGRKFHSGSGRYLLDGWEISGLLSYQTGEPFTIYDSGVPDFSFNAVKTRPRLTGPMPQSGPLVPDAISPNVFLYLPISQVYDPSGVCIAGTAPLACEISVNGPFANTLPRNTFRQPGTYYQNTAVLKNFAIRSERVRLQLRAEFFNLFNHPNLYINAGTNNVFASSFNQGLGQPVPAVTASFRDNRQIVLAAKLIF